MTTSAKAVMAGADAIDIHAHNGYLLAKYPGLLLDYSDVNGSGRIEVF